MAEFLLPDSRYFLTSLDPGSVRAAELLATVRTHCQIENCVFLIKDCWWDEDCHWTTRPGVSEWLTHLTTAVLSVLRILVPPELPTRARADQIAWQPRLGLGLLGLL